MLRSSITPWVFKLKIFATSYSHLLAYLKMVSVMGLLYPIIGMTMGAQFEQLPMDVRLFHCLDDCKLSDARIPARPNCKLEQDEVITNGGYVTILEVNDKNLWKPTVEVVKFHLEAHCYVNWLTQVEKNRNLSSVSVQWSDVERSKVEEVMRTGLNFIESHPDEAECQLLRNRHLSVSWKEYHLVSKVFQGSTPIGNPALINQQCNVSEKFCQDSQYKITTWGSISAKVEPTRVQALGESKLIINTKTVNKKLETTYYLPDIDLAVHPDGTQEKLILGEEIVESEKTFEGVYILKVLDLSGKPLIKNYNYDKLRINTIVESLRSWTHNEIMISRQLICMNQQATWDLAFWLRDVSPIPLAALSKVDNPMGVKLINSQFYECQCGIKRSWFYETEISMKCSNWLPVKPTSNSQSLYWVEQLTGRMVKEFPHNDCKSGGGSFVLPTDTGFIDITNKIRWDSSNSVSPTTELKLGLLSSGALPVQYYQNYKVGAPAEVIGEVSYGSSPASTVESTILSWLGIQRYITIKNIIVITLALMTAKVIVPLVISFFKLLIGLWTFADLPGLASRLSNSFSRLTNRRGQGNPEVNVINPEDSRHRGSDEFARVLI